MGLITEWSEDQKRKGKPHDVICGSCDGCGTTPDRSNKTGIRVCRSCNGHGVVLYDGFATHGYAPKKQTQRVMEIVNDERFRTT